MFLKVFFHLFLVFSQVDCDPLHTNIRAGGDFGHTGMKGRQG